MSPRRRVVVLLVQPFDLRRAYGGAEVIATSIIDALHVEHDVTVLCSYRDGEQPLARPISPNLRIVHGFLLDEHVRSHGHIQPRLTTHAREHLGHADLVVTIERSLAGSPTAPRMVVLGGVGYPHTLELLAHQAWDRLVVPSSFVARQVIERCPSAAGVVVITNGIDTQLFQPPERSRSGGSATLLLPARPVVDKGIRSALRLTAALRHDGLPAVLVCVDQPDEFNGSGVVRELRARARPWVEVRPWQSRMRMPALYAEADVTLCLSEAPEGFGLTAVESIACGTPVLAFPAGFLGHLLPPDHGLHLISATDDPQAWKATVLDAISNGRSRCLTRGRGAIDEQYGCRRMTSQFAQLAQSLLAERNASPANNSA